MLKNRETTTAGAEYSNDQLSHIQKQIDKEIKEWDQ
jgi:hypothetical protein